jgi:hypothetical protein
MFSLQSSREALHSDCYTTSRLANDWSGYLLDKSTVTYGRMTDANSLPRYRCRSVETR